MFSIGKMNSKHPQNDEKQKEIIESWLSSQIRAIGLFPLFCDTIDDDLRISKLIVLSVNKGNVSDSSLNTLNWRLKKETDVETVRIFIEDEPPLRWNIYMWYI